MASSPMLAKLRNLARPTLSALIRLYYVKVWGMDIGEGCVISLQAKLDGANPRGIHIGRDSTVAFGSAILAHDYVRQIRTDTWIGERCYIGAHCIVLAGVRIGDGSIIAAGSIVMRDIPAGCLAYGNPARVIERGIVTGKNGMLISREAGSAAVDLNKDE